MNLNLLLSKLKNNDERDALADKVHTIRCSDGNCIFRSASKPIGMQTNGGCHCLSALDIEKRSAVRLIKKDRDACQKKLDLVIKALELAIEALEKIEHNKWILDGSNEYAECDISSFRQYAGIRRKEIEAVLANDPLN